MFAVMGATGKVGGATARELRRRGLPVRAIVRDATKAQPLAAAGCEVVVADLNDAAAIGEAIAGIDRVLVLCPINRVGDDIWEETGRITDALGSAIERVQPRHVVALSDYGAHRPTGTGVALIFHRLEQWLGTIPVGLTFVRSAEQMENWTRTVQAAPTSGVFRHFHQPLDKVMPVVWSGDVGLIAADLLAGEPSEPGVPRVVHVEGPRRYAVGEFVSTTGELAGRAVEARAMPQDNWIEAMVAGGLSISHARLVAEMYDAHNAGLIDVEPCGTVCRGMTTLEEGFTAIMGRGVAP